VSVNSYEVGERVFHVERRWGLVAGVSKNIQYVGRVWLIRFDEADAAGGHIAWIPESDLERAR
jgi:hypothetical protein